MPYCACKKTADATHSSINVLGWNLGSLSVTPPANSDVDFALTVTAISQEGASVPTASTLFKLIRPPQPSTLLPYTTLFRSTGNEDSAIALSISAALTDTDGS